ncbi:MAG: tRNA pseudouridine(55) synthase TruB [Clostridia bacterium]|nr:MAG: tRNA pseudouridine(55) synthase TruB [Clostridia bacterium]
MDGFVNLLKPPGISSHEAVQRVRRLLGQKTIGHAGTLDPAACGVLVLACGQATRLVEFTSSLVKAYRAQVVLGITTDTLDATGQVTSHRPVSGLTAADVAAVLPAFVGEIWQKPPAFSAIHHRGQRLYELARRGEEVDIAPRRVQVHDLRLLWFRIPCFLLEVKCGGGTYIRSLCADIGQTMGPGACVLTLVRTAVGPFLVGDSYTLAELEAMTQAGDTSFLQPLEAGVEHLPAVTLAAGAGARWQHGQAVGAGDLAQMPPGLAPGYDCRVYTGDGRLAGIGVVAAGVPAEAWHLRPRKVLRY